jgi:hypothetical protein
MGTWVVSRVAARSGSPRRCALEQSDQQSHIGGVCQVCVACCRSARVAMQRIAHRALVVQPEPDMQSPQPSPMGGIAVVALLAALWDSVTSSVAVHTHCLRGGGVAVKLLHPRRQGARPLRAGGTVLAQLSHMSRHYYSTVR